MTRVESLQDELRQQARLSVLYPWGCSSTNSTARHGCGVIR